MNDSFTEIGHQPDQRSIPLVSDLGESGGARGHEDLADSVLETFQGLLVDSDKRASRDLLGDLVLQFPHALLKRELLLEGADFRKNTDLESAHREQ